MSAAGRWLAHLAPASAGAVGNQTGRLRPNRNKEEERS